MEANLPRNSGRGNWLMGVLAAGNVFKSPIDVLFLCAFSQFRAENRYALFLELL